MNNTERLKLKELIAANNVVDQTENIRKLKHSGLIMNDIKQMQMLLKEYSRLDSKSETFKQMASNKCSFLFNNYTEIFNKIINRELDFDIMAKLLYVLQEIEDGKVDQHEGSYKIGTLLKKIYIDGVIKDEEKPKTNYKNISWKRYKEL